MKVTFEGLIYRAVIYSILSTAPWVKILGKDVVSSNYSHGSRVESVGMKSSMNRNKFRWGGCREKEAKKEAFRKYLESSGVIDAVTKGLVALYEQNNKPTSAIEFVQQKLGGPTVAEHEKLQAELSELQAKYDELLATHQETCKQLEQYKISSTIITSDETTENKPHNVHDGGKEEAGH